MNVEQIGKKLHSVIVIDDEDEVREGMRDLVPWEQLGFIFAGAAENGREALDLVERTMPDAVICDINMPIMNGLEFAEQLQRKSMKTKLIFLTGYDEFEYAQQAVKLNVYDYVLKPLTPSEVEQMMHKLKTDLECESIEVQQLQQLKMKLRESLPVLRERYLNQWVSGRIPFEDVVRRLDSVGVHIQNEYWTALVISVDSVHSDRFRHDEELLAFAIANICEEWIGRHLHRGYVFANALNEPATLLASDCADCSVARSEFYMAAEQIRESIEKYLKVAVTVGLGPCVKSSDVPSCYRDALRALDYRFIMEGNKVLFIEDVEMQDTYTADPFRLSELSDCIVSQLKVSTRAETLQWIDQFFSELTGSKMDPERCKVYVIELVTLLSKSYHGFILDGSPYSAESGQGSSLHPVIQVSGCRTLQQMKQWIEQWCAAVIEAITSRREHSYESMVKQATDFLHLHFSEEDVSVQTLCDYLHVSASHFSLIFKKVTGETFIEYLTGIRLQKARELLRTTALKTYEIAERVGFKNTHYFSIVFKKGVGVAPTEYRSRVLGMS